MLWVDWELDMDVVKLCAVAATLALFGLPTELPLFEFLDWMVVTWLSVFATCLVGIYAIIGDPTKKVASPG